MVRGISTILQPRANFNNKSIIPPNEARSKVFLETGKKVILSEKERNQVLKKVAKTLKLNVTDLYESLYADLEDEQKLEEFIAPKPESLLKYYNYSLTCAILTYATKIQLSFKEKDNLMKNLSTRLGETLIKQNNSTWIQIQLTPTKRPSLRSTKIDDLLERLIILPHWSLSAEIMYPSRYKKPVTLDINWRKTGKLIEKDPIEIEQIIEIYEKKHTEYGEIINLEELAHKKGTTEASILKEVKSQDIKYLDLGGILITPQKHKEIKKSLEGIKNLESAKKKFKQHGINNFIPILESMGYTIEWTNPRNKSRVYQLG